MLRSPPLPLRRSDQQHAGHEQCQLPAKKPAAKKPAAKKPVAKKPAPVKVSRRDKKPAGEEATRLSRSVAPRRHAADPHAGHDMSTHAGHNLQSPPATGPQARPRHERHARACAMSLPATARTIRIAGHDMSSMHRHGRRRPRR